MESLDKYLWFIITTLHMKEFEEEYFSSFPVSTPKVWCAINVNNMFFIRINRVHQVYLWDRKRVSIIPFLNSHSHSLAEIRFYQVYCVQKTNTQINICITFCNTSTAITKTLNQAKCIVSDPNELKQEL